LMAGQVSVLPQGMRVVCPVAHWRIMSAVVGSGAAAGGGWGSWRFSLSWVWMASTSHAFSEICVVLQWSMT
jgi:hypothetical protein